MKRRRRNRGEFVTTTTTTRICGFLLMSICCMTPSLLLSSSCRCHAFLPGRIRQHFSKHIDRSKYETCLYSEKDNNSTSRKLRAAGVYARPSAAIERGSGFFVPGLEGPRVRLLFGVLILFLTALNHSFLVTTSSSSGLPVLSETLAIGYSLLLLLQAGIEFSKATASSSTSGRVKKRISSKEEEEESDNNKEAWMIQQAWASSSTTANSSYRERVQWAAASFLAMTPATSMLLLDSSANNQVLYRLGESQLLTNEQEGVQAAMETVQQSKSGRVSLPLTHPAVEALVTTRNDDDDDDNVSKRTRCVVLQRINDNQCWMMTSNQLLAAFTKSDLKFLGQMGLYVDMKQHS